MKALENPIEKQHNCSLSSGKKPFQHYSLQSRSLSSATLLPSGHLRKIFYCSTLSLKSSCLFRFVVFHYGVCQIIPFALTKKYIYFELVQRYGHVLL